MIENGWEKTPEEQALIADVRCIKQSDIPNLKAQIERMTKAIEQLNISIANCTSTITQLETDMNLHLADEICIINERLGKLKDRFYSLSDF